MNKRKRNREVLLLIAASLVTFYFSIEYKNGNRENYIEERIEISGYEDNGITKAVSLKDKDENIIGYRVSVNKYGYSKDAPVSVEVTFSNDIKVISDIRIISHSETPSVGGRIEEDEFLSQFIGKELPITINGDFIGSNDKTNEYLSNNNIDKANLYLSEGNNLEKDNLEEKKNNLNKEDNNLNKINNLKDYCNSIQLLGKSENNKRKLKDGTYMEFAETSEYGFTDVVVITVNNGRITEVLADSITSYGESKRNFYKSENGELSWEEQINELTKYVIENQGLKKSLVNKNGYTNAIDGVDIKVDGFAELINKCILGAEKAYDMALFSGSYERVYVSDDNRYRYKASVEIKNGLITDILWDMTDEDTSIRNFYKEYKNLDALDKGNSSKSEMEKYEKYKAWIENADKICEDIIKNQGTKINSEIDVICSKYLETFKEARSFCTLTLECIDNSRKDYKKNDELQNSTLMLEDGVYIEKSAAAEDGYYSQVVMTIDGGIITDLVWDSVDRSGEGKRILSMTGRYVMSDSGLLWAEQADALAEYVIEHQETDSLNVDENGETDVVAGVSISVSSFVNQVNACLERARAAYTSKPSYKLKNGRYSATLEKDSSGYTSVVSLVVAKERIVSVEWDSVDDNGNSKSVMSVKGQYVMNENGAPWHEQAAALATYVIEHQGLDDITKDGKKTDALAIVSISIDDFINGVEECLNKAGAKITAIPTAPEATNLPQNDANYIDAVSGATFSSRAVVEAVNTAYEYLYENRDKLSN